MMSFIALIRKNPRDPIKPNVRTIGLGIILVIALLATPSRAQPDVERPPLFGISHVAFLASDLSEAHRFYGSRLGYQLERHRVEMASGNTQERHYYWVNPRQFIEIVPGLTPEKNDRLDHIAFETGDVVQMRRYLQQQGVNVPNDVENGPAGNRQFSVEDPDRHTIAFIEYTGADPLTDRRERPIGPTRISDRILHVGLTISDPDAANAFYQKVLGFDEIWRGGPDGQGPRWINMQVPESTDYLEYMLWAKNPSREQLGGIHHLCLQVASMQKAIDHLRKKVDGWPFPGPGVGRIDRWILNLRDPDGTRVELMEGTTTRSGPKTTF